MMIIETNGKKKKGDLFTNVIIATVLWERLNQPRWSSYRFLNLIANVLSGVTDDFLKGDSSTKIQDQFSKGLTKGIQLEIV